MLKRVALITRKPGMTRDEFHAHWNAIHGPLVAEHPNVLRYVQDNIVHKERFVDRNPDPAHPLAPDYQGPEVDGIAELWFENRQAMDEVFASPHARLMLQDGMTHLGTITTFVVEERDVIDRRVQAKGLLLSLAGQRILVTGAGAGIGRAIALGLARAGAEVLVVDIDLAAAQAVATAIGAAGGMAQAHGLDVTSRAACKELAAALRQVPVTGLVNNAGVAIPRTMDAQDIEHAWDSTWAVNANGVFNVTLAFLAQLRETRGAILNMSSVAARSARSRNTAYQSSKAAVSQMTRGWAVEFAEYGIRVNALAPGPIETVLSRHTRTDPERIARTLSRVPMARYGQPEDLVGAATFLLSSQAAFITGAVLPIDGGYEAT